MNKLKELFIDFCEYLKSYKNTLKTIMLIFALTLTPVIVNSKYFEIILVYYILTIPIFLVHLIKPVDKNKKSLEKKQCLSKNKRTKLNGKVLKLFMNKVSVYLKTYILILIIIFIGIILLNISYLGMSIFILTNINVNFGTMILYILLSFVMFESISILFSCLIACVYLLYMNKSIINSFLSSFKFNRKYFLKHFFNVSVFALITIPIIALSTSLKTNIYLSTILIILYLLLLINFSVFDIKKRLD